MSRLGDRDGLRDFAPLAERALSVDGDALIRFRSGDGRIGGFVRLPYEVLAGRTLERWPAPTRHPTAPCRPSSSWSGWTATVRATNRHRPTRTG